ncbi:MAG: amidohydrolase family protein [Planctomycetaceae bacterium]|nr:amidohydrolase family protein [Planctomycetales bacterium]MCB9921941.1 amidohydrolase family protein [Planctomycetaceae bacterium]
MAPIELTDLDRRIWEEELTGFVPERVFDVHTHIYRWAFFTDPDKESTSYRQFVTPPYEEANWRLLDECDRLLMPGRQVSRLAFPFPFAEYCDFDRSNRFVAKQVSDDPASGALMLVRPEMTADEITTAVRGDGILGLKPYRFYSKTGDAVNCRITDFLPEHQIEVADQLGLLIMMHLSRPDAIGDELNIADLERLTATYPRAKWILAHCARSYAAWPIERAGQRLADLPNVWFDTSSVCESDAIEALIRTVGAERVMYGSDDVPVGVLRGKYISFGYGWAYLSPSNQQLNLTHCDPRMTFTRYEQLRAMQRAGRRGELSKTQTRAMFYDTAAELVARTRTGLFE